MAIDVGDALDAIARAIDLRGADHVHRARWDSALRRRCWRYQFDGQPECLVGLVLSMNGVSGPELDTLGERSFRELFVIRALPIAVTIGGAVVLDRAQRVQDAGCTWGVTQQAAVRVAVRYSQLTTALRLASSCETVRTPL